MSKDLADSASEGALRRFLLGRMPEKQRSRFEEQVLAEHSLFELLEAAEGELLEAYVRGELSRKERRLFEERYRGTTDRETRIEVARTLAVAADAQSPGTNPHPSPGRGSAWRARWAALMPRHALAVALAVMVLVMVLGGLQLALDDGVSPDPHGRDQVADTQATVSYDLSPILRSATRRQRLEVPPGTQVVALRLRVNPGEPYRSYRAVLQTAQQDSVWSEEGLEAPDPSSGGVLELAVPAAALEAPGSYVLTLWGELANGDFQVMNYYEFVRPTR